VAGGPGQLGGVVYTNDGGLAELVGGVGHWEEFCAFIGMWLGVQVCFNLSTWVVGVLLKGMAGKVLGEEFF